MRVEVDADSVFEHDEFLQALPVSSRLTQTPNGYHVVSEPFDYTDRKSPVEYDDLDTDGQVFIDAFGDK